MRFIERFRRRNQAEIKAPVTQIPEELIDQVREKLLDDLQFGFRFEIKHREYNSEELDEIMESDLEENEEPSENDLTRTHEGLEVILKGSGKTYLLSVWRTESERFIRRNKSGVNVSEYDNKAYFSDDLYTRAAFFSPERFSAFIGYGWRSKEGYYWSSSDATPQQTLSLFHALMNAKVDLAATQNEFSRRLREKGEHETLTWPIQST